MQVSLTPELQSRVQAKVESGLYDNASEVIREALRFMDAHEDWINEIKIAHLREQLNIGLAQLEQGQGITVESKASLDRLFEAIKA